MDGRRLTPPLPHHLLFSPPRRQLSQLSRPAQAKEVERRLRKCEEGVQASSTETIGLATTVNEGCMYGLLRRRPIRQPQPQSKANLHSILLVFSEVYSQPAMLGTSWKQTSQGPSVLGCRDGLRLTPFNFLREGGEGRLRCHWRWGLSMRAR